MTDAMYITTTYLGAPIGSFQYLMFLLTEDYIEAQAKLKDELGPVLEIFAKRLGSNAAVVRPFAGHEEGTRVEIMNLSWNAQQRDELMHTPGLLILDRQLGEFDPSRHEWGLVNLRGTLQSVRELFKELEDFISQDKNLFDEVRRMDSRSRLEAASKVFELKPGAFGFSINLKQAVRFLRSVIRG